MKVIATPLDQLLIIEPKVFEDPRGYFFEAYNKRTWAGAGLNYEFVQDNTSWSKKGVLRGLHLQLGDSAQTKLVSVLKGKVLDVVVDLRRDSPTFKKQFSLELSDENKRQLLVPRGFAHGFVTLSESALFIYKCDNLYNPKTELGILFNDPDLNIDWGLPADEIEISDKDRKNMPLKNFLNDFGGY